MRSWALLSPARSQRKTKRGSVGSWSQRRNGCSCGLSGRGMATRISSAPGRVFLKYCVDEVDERQARSAQLLRVKLGSDRGRPLDRACNPGHTGPGSLSSACDVPPCLGTVYPSSIGSATLAAWEDNAVAHPSFFFSVSRGGGFCGQEGGGPSWTSPTPPRLPGCSHRPAPATPTPSPDSSTDTGRTCTASSTCASTPASGAASIRPTWFRKRS